MAENIDQLIVQLGDTVIQTVSLTMPVVTIGRSSENILTLPHRSVSRRHAEIRIVSDATVIVDLGSVNGITVDGERLLAHQIRPLTCGAVVRIGPYALVYSSRSTTAIDDASVYEENTFVDALLDLHIEIDPQQRERQVKEITESAYFRHLRDASRRLRPKD